jgi:hypothetical protein
MKKLFQTICIVLFAATLLMTACTGKSGSSKIGGSDAVSLARQVHSEFQKEMKAIGEKETSLALAMWLLKISKEETPFYKEIEGKIMKLSESDRLIYQAEIDRLMGD